MRCLVGREIGWVWMAVVRALASTAPGSGAPSLAITGSAIPHRAQLVADGLAGWPHAVQRRSPATEPQCGQTSCPAGRTARQVEHSSWTVIG
jgi:hypothetical protein